MMKKKKLIFFMIVISGLSFWGITKYRTQTPAATNAVWVLTAPVKEITLPVEVHALGTLTAKGVEISSELAGHVKEIFFQDGSFVEKGTALLQLDDAIYKTKYELAKAKLGYSTTNFKRMELLGKQGAISKQAIDQAEADLKERKADADENRVMVSKMQLSAPFAGKVGKSKVNLGDYVTVGQAIVTLTDTKRLRVEFNIPEKYLPALKLGQVISVTTAAYPEQKFLGTVAFISPTINSENRSIALYAEVANKENKLAPGMFVNVSQGLGMTKGALVIPARAIVPTLDGQQVYKVVAGKAQSVAVILGRRLREEVVVLEGLKPGDIVITDGQLKVKNGSSVSVKT